MITPLPRGLDTLPDHAVAEDDLGRRRSRAPDPSRRERASKIAPARPTVASVTRGVQQLRATWTSKHGCFELVVGVHAAGLHMKLCSWLQSGAALEECFVIHTLLEFEHWIGRSPTKFDHPVAHEEVRRFAHGNLPR